MGKVKSLLFGGFRCFCLKKRVGFLRSRLITVHQPWLLSKLSCGKQSRGDPNAFNLKPWSLCFAKELH